MIAIGHQVKLEADIALCEPVRDLRERIDVHAAMAGSKVRDRPDFQRHFVNHTEHPVAEAKRAQQMLLCLADLHHFSAGGDDLHVNHLS